MSFRSFMYRDLLGDGRVGALFDMRKTFRAKLRDRFDNQFRARAITKDLHNFVAFGVPHDNAIFQQKIFGRL